VKYGNWSRVQNVIGMHSLVGMFLCIANLMGSLWRSHYADAIFVKEKRASARGNHPNLNKGWIETASGIEEKPYSDDKALS